LIKEINVSTDIESQEKSILKGAEGSRALNDNVMILAAQGNGLAVKTEDGLVLVDAGPGRGTTAKMISDLRAWSDLPVKAICYSHGHAGYNDGVPVWLAHAEERGDTAPQLIAHENVTHRYDRYRETAGLQRTLNAIQFPNLKLNNPEKAYTNPTVTFRERMTYATRGRRIELIWAPSETDDALVMWLPDDGILYAGAALPGTMMPNIGTPLRTQRLTIRWAETLEMLADLGATSLVSEFGQVIEGADQARKVLLSTARALRWLRQQVVDRMNQGMSDVEIIHAIDYPKELFDYDWMRERYGAGEYIVRDIYREENGWWDRNATNLHPGHPDAAATAVLSAITDKQAVIDRAKALVEAGDVQAALHVIDLLALAPGDDPVLIEARHLKAGLCHLRAEEISPYVSKALYKSTAKLLESGRRRWSTND